MDAWRGAEVPVLPGRGVEPRLRDTVTGRLAVAAAGKRASLYACGITPYDSTHMGHAATFTAWDLLIRTWLDTGHDVRYVQNVTDVDDPLLERADRDGEDWRELALRETERYLRDMEALRLLPPARLIGAVEALPVIERFTERLATRGALYDLEGDVYFARGTDASFGALAGPGTATGLTLAQMTELSAERGGDPARPGKKDPLDALVWRSQRPGEPAWDSRFGRGRPGWHVECAAIATEYLGAAFDVQAGGSDLVFPHHELSASHTRVALSATDGGSAGHVFARLYAHSGMVAYQGTKMSKSLGNLVFVSHLLASGVDPMAVRLALLAHHYRSDWEWTDDVLAEAAARLSRWRAATAQSVPAGPGVPPATAVPDASAVLQRVRERLADDLDAPGALAAIDAWADAVHPAPCPPDAAPRPPAAASHPGVPSPAITGNDAILIRNAALIRNTADALLGIAI
jgi:L-cysteine:1D-myo-inositol 2-amino-2-deoxy-alpha-D-glucopyranoside ligase